MRKHTSSHQAYPRLLQAVNINLKCYPLFLTRHECLLHRGWVLIWHFLNSEHEMPVYELDMANCSLTLSCSRTQYKMKLMNQKAVASAENSPHQQCHFQIKIFEKAILTFIACCTKKEPLSKDTSSYMTVLLSVASSCLSELTDLLILAWPSIKRSTTPWRSASGSIFTISAPHNGQSLKRDIHALISNK